LAVFLASPCSRMPKASALARMMLSCMLRFISLAGFDAVSHVRALRSLHLAQRRRVAVAHPPWVSGGLAST
jgi:hypothetical protein